MKRVEILHQVNLKPIGTFTQAKLSNQIGDLKTKSLNKAFNWFNFKPKQNTPLMESY